MMERPTPICFWKYAGRPGSGEYIEPALQEGTTPLVKRQNDRATRDFLNYRHPNVRPQDFAGARAILDGRYKLVIDGGNQTGREFFDVRADPAEKNNLIRSHPEMARRMEQSLHGWQRSVLSQVSPVSGRWIPKDVSLANGSRS